MVDILEPDAPIPSVTPLDIERQLLATLTSSSRRVFAGERVPVELRVAAAVRSARASLRGGASAALETVGDRSTGTLELPADLRDGVAVVIARFEYATQDGWRDGVATLPLLGQRSVPLHFTGVFEDRLRAGHLVVSAGVQVRRPGRYILHAILRDAADVPLAYATWDNTLGSDDTTVDFRFFGRLLLDAGDGGPYRLTLAWGGLYRTDRLPERLGVATWHGVHETAPYAAERLSDAEWDAPEKRRRLRMLAALHRATR